MSSAQEDVMRAAGHSPAVKAGGMRVKPARVHEEAKKEQQDAKEANPWETENAHQDSADVVVAGVNVTKEKISTPESVKSTHVKPLPTHQKPVQNKQSNMIIQQPR